jgi:hypothetical protein
VTIKKSVIILSLALLLTVVSVAKAIMTVSIEVKDTDGNNIGGSTVPVGTVAIVYGQYDNTQGNQATASIKVYFSVDNTVYTLKATLFDGVVDAGRTVQGLPFKLMDIGYYEFRWTCTEIVSGSRCTNQAMQTRAVLNNLVPEPAPILGASMAILALGLFCFRRRGSKVKKAE